MLVSGRQPEDLTDVALASREWTNINEVIDTFLYLFWQLLPGMTM